MSRPVPTSGTAQLAVATDPGSAVGEARPQPAAPSTAPRSRGERYPALDGLRGVAALVVVVFHVLLISPVFDSPEISPGPSSGSWWITHTPLGLVWAGPQAVYVFFVLSGFVLTLPAATIRWRAYYPQRLIRLYLPVWAAVVIAVALVLLFPRDPQPWLSEWWAERGRDADLGSVVRDAVLVLGAGAWNSPLWSLRYEVLFSLLLPVYLAAGKLLARWGLARIGVLLLVTAAAQALGHEDLAFMSMFGFGVLLAVERQRLAEIATWMAGRGRWAWLTAGIVCAVLLDAELLLLLDDGQVTRGIVMGLQLAGASLLVFLALHWHAVRHALCAPWVQWVGVRSFALYLVHEPIVLSLVAVAPGVSVVGHVVIGLPVSLLAAHYFHRWIEAPAHRLSRTAARRLAPGAPRR